MLTPMNVHPCAHSATASACPWARVSGLGHPACLCEAQTAGHNGLKSPPCIPPQPACRQPQRERQQRGGRLCDLGSTSFRK